MNQKAELTETTLPGLMLEFCNLSLLQDFTCKTTRVLHTHLPYRFLSSSKLIGQCKTIVIVRNPKDTCVSYHNHSKKDIFINYDISWNEFFEKWMTEESKYHFQNFRKMCLEETIYNIERVEYRLQNIGVVITKGQSGENGNIGYIIRGRKHTHTRLGVIYFQMY